jgi:hypothetical protein
LVVALTILIVIEGLAGTLGVLPVLKYMLDNRALPTVFAGIRALSGPFEALGNDAMLATGLVFVVVSAFRFLAAYWIWNLRMDGFALELILLGLSIPFWYGFAVPFGPVLGIPVFILLILTRSSFS